MLTMAACAVYLAVRKQQPGNIIGGALTLYLIATAWRTAQHRDGRIDRFDRIALLVPLLGGITLWILGIAAVAGAITPQAGAPVAMYFVMGTILLLAAAGDIRMLVRGGIFGRQRILRHVWRMCFGLFIATGSFFLGQGAKVFPESVVDSGVLFFPALLPLVLLIYWVLRVRLSGSDSSPAFDGAGQTS